MELSDTTVMFVEPPATNQVYRMIERCGRIAYKSEDKITDESAIPFIRNLIKRGHESVLEHVSLTAHILTDRGTSHALVRHRIASYTQESTIYCDYRGEVEYRTPFFLKDEEAMKVWCDAMEHAEASYNKLRALGIKPGQARDVLPNATKTEVMATYNIRNWRHVIRTRMAKADSDGMHLVMAKALSALLVLYPVLFEDVVDNGCLIEALVKENAYDYGI